jgi:trehalose 6-phosphate phosphatase
VLDVAAIIDALAEHPGETALLCDFDGSLAEIVARPEDAVALPAAAPVLRRLAAGLGRVGIVSGRPVEFLAGRLQLPELLYVGLYGMETIAGGVRRVDPRVLPYGATVATASDEAERALPGVIVERKSGVSVTLHWRTTPEREHEVLAVAADLARRHGLDEWHSRFAVELRPPVAIDKGTAVDALIEGFAVGAFAGDDTGDLAAFAALERAAADHRLRGAARIGVRSPEMPEALPAAVDVLVDGPRGLVTLLESVADRLGL